MKKGISLVALIATVSIMIILITTVTISGIATADNSKKLTLSTELTLLKESIDGFNAKSNGEYPISGSISLDISNVSNNSKLQFNGENIVNNKVILYEIDYKLMGITSLKYGLKKDGLNDIYVFSKDTKRVYYAKGIAVGNKTYYTLTDDLKSMIDYKIGDGTPISRDGVIFEPSEINWTKKDVTVKVKIPKHYISKTVTANGNNITANVVEGEYNVYSVTGIKGNYTIVANYSKATGEEILSSKYVISNVDNVSPILSLDKNNQKLMDSGNPEEMYAYFEILEKTDALSGIKTLKYENEKIKSDEIEMYFKTNGKTVYKDIITIDKNVKEITVYLEDKAGNWRAEYVTINSNIFTKLLEI